MELFIDFTWLAVGLVMLYFGAEWLVQGAASLALKVGLAPLVVGLTVVAFGTSAPELLVSLQANMEDPPKGGFALGNIIGSNICNIALILGVAAVIRPINVPKEVVKRDLPILLVVTLAFVWMLRNGADPDTAVISKVEATGLVIALITFIVISIVGGLKSGADADLEGLDAEDIANAKKAPASKVFLFLGLIVLGLAVLAVGANRLIEGGVGIATAFGVPDVIIALSLVALGTSLPELATCIIACKRQEGDIIVGNVIGSNLFNIMAVIGITAIIAPLVSNELKGTDILLMLGLTFLGAIFMVTKKTLGRVEGAILLVIYAGYMGYMFIAQ